jgi:fimbrial chaperone protein
MRKFLGAAAAAFCAYAPVLADASTLRIAPVSLELQAPASAAKITLRSDGARPVNIQVRVFRWRQTGGKDELEPTRDVVASPPISTIAPGVDYVVRVLRIKKEPVIGEETYRLLVDELPDPAMKQADTVNMLLRYSVPVFFTSPSASGQPLDWQVQRTPGGLALVASNDGDTYVRISNLAIRTRGGGRVPLRDGLLGYVLGTSRMRWQFPNLAALPAGGELQLVGESSQGGFDVAVAVGK